MNMIKLFTILTIAALTFGCQTATKAPIAAIKPHTGVIDFGDYTSETLTNKAWGAMDVGAYKDAITYANKCIELFEGEAVKMQAQMREQAETTADGEKPRKVPTNDEIFANWALNDVGTSYFIKGEALSNMGKNNDAKVAYKAVMNQFNHAKTWDPKGWFWSPAEAASQKISAMSKDF